MGMHLQPDLASNAMAAQYIKDEIIDVVFANQDGSLQSREGPNHYRSGDALITGPTGDRWTFSRDRFEARYETVGTNAEAPGTYRAKPGTVWARQMESPFTIARCAGGDVLAGLAGDWVLHWVLQYAPGDYGVVGNARFQRVYRRV